MAVVRHMSDEIAVMYLGRIVEQAPAEQLFAAARHPYTRLLLETIPDLEAPNRNRVPLAGEVPSPIEPPPGCAFHPRCLRAEARCRDRGSVVARDRGRPRRLPLRTLMSPKVARRPVSRS